MLFVVEIIVQKRSVLIKAGNDSFNANCTKPWLIVKEEHLPVATKIFEKEGFKSQKKEKGTYS